jgi:undecaprenyl-phosphate 4-deoxy-4-formamido-L-arabinose transferase
MTITIVIPVYRGANSIGPLVHRLIDILGRSPYGLQIVLVNDGSPDNSHEVCLDLHTEFPDIVTYLKLARNFGEHRAVMAGLNHAGGDYVVIMDDDFQNPPEEVTRLIDHAVKYNYDVVYTYYNKKHHHWFRNLGSKLNDVVANVMLGKPRGLYLSSFKCLSRFLVKEIIKYSAPYPYIDGLALRSTQNIGTIQVRHEPRREGQSNYTFRKLVSLWLSMFVNFSVMPLRVSTVMGLIFSAMGFLMSLVVVIEWLARPETPPGYSSVIVSVVLFSGVQLIMLGLVGEYLGRLFLTNNQTPQFVVRELYEAPQRPHRTDKASSDSAPALSPSGSPTT